MKPPACRCHPPWGRYAGFLSHYKVQAGTDARLLGDLLQRMLGVKVFLDSSNLQDLRALYEAVKNSDVLLLLGTSGVLYRPYCLLEIWTAHSNRKPVVVIPIDGQGWNRDDALKPCASASA
eukprot:5047430-Prymnesium_polylepis.1